jgi:hypothetical protein
MINQPLGYNQEIAAYVRNHVRAGVTMKDIMSGIAKWQDAPRTLKTLYKWYGDDIADARNSVIEAVGSKVIEQAKDGCTKSQDLFLRSKGGWSPNQTVATKDEEDLDTDESVILELMTLLGKDE